MNYVFYDLETTGKNKDWSQIIQFGAILVNENLEELERFESKCNLKSGIIPEPEALVVNNNRIRDLSNLNYSHYNLINEINQKFKQWSPAIFFGFNSINFDEEILRKSFFKSLLDIYITQLDGNKRGDILSLTRASFFYDDTSLKSLLNLKGKASFRLEDLSKANKIAHNAHDAMGDVEATIALTKIIKNKSPELWRQCLNNCHKNDVEKFIKNTKKFSFLEYSFGRVNSYTLTFLFHHTEYNYLQCYDLSIDPDELITMSYSELKSRMREKPKFIKSLSQSKFPSIFEYEYSNKMNKCLDIDEEILNYRVNQIINNEQFVEKIKLILKEEHDEKEGLKPQLDVLAEESLYRGGFPIYKDTQLMKKFHSSSWDEKFKISTEFHDHRFTYFAQRIIYEEAPEVLPKSVFNEIHKSIANQILTLDNVNWFTIPKAYKQIDDLREKYKNENNLEKLDFLGEINDFLEKLQSIYEPAKNL